MSGKQPCVECGRPYSIKWIKRHLVKDHGYRYDADGVDVQKEGSE
jgi:hypothetical protein